MALSVAASNLMLNAMAMYYTIVIHEAARRQVLPIPAACSHRVGSRSQAVGGTALQMAGTKVKVKMAKFAAELLEAHAEDLVFESGTITVKGSPASAKKFADVAAYAYVPVPLPEGLEPGLSEEAFFEPTNNTYPFGCHISMLEIDRETGEPTLLKLVAVDDAGNLINPLIVEGQIHGGIAH